MRTVQTQPEVSIDMVAGVQAVPDNGNQDEDGVDEEADDPDVALVLLPRQIPQADHSDKQA